MTHLTFPSTKEIVDANERISFLIVSIPPLSEALIKRTSIPSSSQIALADVVLPVPAPPYKDHILNFTFIDLRLK